MVKVKRQLQLSSSRCKSLRITIQRDGSLQTPPEGDGHPQLLVVEVELPVARRQVLLACGGRST
jgi:hypothetical protein